MTEEKRFIVRRKQGAIMCLLDIQEVQESEVINRDGTLEVVTTRDPEGLKKKLREDPLIESVEEDFECVAFLDASAVEIGAPEAWREGYTGKGVKVAVIDTGVYGEHPDFEGRVTKVIDCTGGNFQDIHWHGTHVAGIIAGNNYTYKGIAPKAEIFDVRVLNSDGRGYASWIIKGMWAANEAGCVIANMSLGSNTPNHGRDVLSIEANKVVEAGTLIVAASGNSGGKVGPPGAAEKVLTVGATDGHEVADFSSYGVDASYQKPECVAPGVSIKSLSIDPPLKIASGTSMAAPHVAGFAALLNEYWVEPAPHFIKADIIEACEKLEGELDSRQGWGKIFIPKMFEEPEPEEACPWCHTESYDCHVPPCEMRESPGCEPSFWKCLFKCLKNL